MADPITHLPRTSALAWRALRSRGRRGEIEDLPEVHLKGLRVNAEQLAAYHRLCGFPTAGPVPLTYLFVLAFQAQVALLTDRRFPLAALGMVHRANTFELLDVAPLHDDESLSLIVRAGDIETVEKGREVSVETLFLRQGQEIARSISRQFARGHGHGKKPEASLRPGPPNDKSSVWSLEPNLGRRYAKASGDHNPIHLYPWSARLLGYRRPIAHGMYLAARALAECEPHRGPNPWRRLEVRFKTPTFLPSRPHFFHKAQDQRASFELWSHDLERPHLTGSVSTAR